MPAKTAASPVAPNVWPMFSATGATGDTDMKLSDVMDGIGFFAFVAGVLYLGHGMGW